LISLYQPRDPDFLNRRLPEHMTPLCGWAEFLSQRYFHPYTLSSHISNSGCASYCTFERSLTGAANGLLVQYPSFPQDDLSGRKTGRCDEQRTGTRPQTFALIHFPMVRTNQRIRSLVIAPCRPPLQFELGKQRRTMQKYIPGLIAMDVYTMWNATIMKCENLLCRKPPIAPPN